MTLVETLCFVTGLSGLTLGAAFGTRVYGVLGGLAGAPLGGVAGLLGAACCFAALESGLDFLSERLRRRMLRPHFAGYLSSDRSPEWGVLTYAIHPGDMVEGVVVAVGSGGVAVDLGFVFPGWIPDHELRGLPESQRQPLLVIGSQVEARIRRFEARVVELTLRPRPAECLEPGPRRDPSRE